MSLRLEDTAPDFAAVTTEGPITFTNGYHQRIALAHLHVLSLRRLLEMCAGDLEAGRKRVGTATRDLPRDVEEDHAVHYQIGGEAVDAEIRPDAGRR